MPRPIDKGPNLALRQERERRNWSQAYVAEKIGVDVVSVSRWERGTNAPTSPYTIKQVCNLFGKTAEELGFFSRRLDEPSIASPTQEPSLDMHEDSANSSGPAGRQVDSSSDQIPRTQHFPHEVDVVDIPPSNLPTPLTTLIGREQEVTAVCLLLHRPQVRLVTLTGTAGVGKTRLALEVARELVHDFADGIHLISLAPISDPALAIPTIAHSMGLTESRSQPLLDLLKAALQNKHMLLVLDNFEQILPAAPQLTDLLASCPQVKLLMTSRFTLHVQGEHKFPVPPLAVPDLKQFPEQEVLAQYATITLFLQRAQATKPTFQITHTNAHAIAEICVRLDGLPLAIELAATRIKLLSPHALLTRLKHRLHVLTGGTQDTPTRQQTLRNAIDWSYHLLSAQEQRLWLCCKKWKEDK